MEDLKAAAEKELERIGPAVESAELVSEKGKKILQLAKAYLSDGKHFFEKGSYLDSFEAAVIAWAYVDAGLNLGVLKVGKEFLSLFTV